MAPGKHRADSTLEKLQKILLGWQNPTKQLIHCVSHAENVPTCLGRHKLVFLKGELKSEGKTHGAVIINASNSKWGDGRLFDRTVNYQGMFPGRFIQALALYALQQH